MKYPKGLAGFALSALVIVGVLAASVGIRIYPTLLSPDTTRMLSEPVLTEFDGYYYLRYAKEYCAGEYMAGEVDHLRGAHNLIKRPLIPLLSAAACYASRVSGAAMEHVALFMPLVFSAFISIPIWLYRKSIGGELGAAVAIAFAITSPIYILRTKAGFFDTDCLNVFFMLMVLWLLQQSALSRSWSGVVYAALGGALFKIFMLWYDKPVLYYFFALVLAALLVLNLRENGLLASGLRLMFFAAAGYMHNLPDPFRWMHIYIPTNLARVETVSGLPNVATSVGELVHPSFWTSVTLVHGGVFVIAGALGLIWLAASRLRDAASLLFLFALGAIGLFSGMRYLIYIVPVVGIGLGFLVSRGSEILSGKLRNMDRRWILSTALAVAAALAVILYSPREHHDYVPIFGPEPLKGLRALRSADPGLVWNWWDQGYPIQEISGLPTYVDGGVNQNAYYVGLSFMQHEQRHARNIIMNVLNAHTKVSRDWIETDIGKLRAQPAAAPGMPVYLIFTSDLIDKHRWIYNYGNWDFKSGTGDSTHKLWYLGAADNSIAKDVFPTHTGNMVDLRKGLVYYKGQMVLLQGVHRVSDKDPGQQEFLPLPYAADSIFILELVRHPDRTDAFLVDKDFYVTVLNRMFILGDYDPALFDLVYADSTMSRIYRLR